MPESVNIEQLRHSLQEKWLTYYFENREWLVQLSIWVTCEGQYRPSASFILATLTALDPQLTRLMPLLAGLNSNPERIVSALGLNFNPDDRVEHWLRETKNKSNPVQVLPSVDSQVVDVAFHPDATFVDSTLSFANPTDANANVSALNSHQSHPTQRSINSRSINQRPINKAKDDADHSAIAPPNPQLIARKDEECGGRDRNPSDHIWR